MTKTGCLCYRFLENHNYSGALLYIFRSFPNKTNCPYFGTYIVVRMLVRRRSFYDLLATQFLAFLILYKVYLISFTSLFLASEYYLQKSKNATRRQLCFTEDRKNDFQTVRSDSPYGIRQRLQANMKTSTRYCERPHPLLERPSMP